MCESQKVIADKCDECLSNINERVDGVLEKFEVHSYEMFNNFETKQNLSLKNQEVVADGAIFTYLKNQENKHDEAFSAHLKVQREKHDTEFSQHLEKQAIKYENFEKKVLGLIWKVLAFVFGVVILCSAVVAVTWITVQNKAEKKDTLSLLNAKAIIDSGDKYRDQRYVIRKDETLEKYHYQWCYDSVFADILKN